MESIWLDSKYIKKPVAVCLIEHPKATHTCTCGKGPFCKNDECCYCFSCGGADFGLPALILDVSNTIRIWNENA